MGRPEGVPGPSASVYHSGRCLTSGGPRPLGFPGAWCPPRFLCHEGGRAVEPWPRHSGFVGSLSQQLVGGGYGCPKVMTGACPPGCAFAPAGPPSGPTASASWRSRSCSAGQPSPSGMRAGRAGGSTAACRWTHDARWAPCAFPCSSRTPAPCGTVPEAGVPCPLPQVVAFCDVDENKIKKGFYCYEDSQVCGARQASPPPRSPTTPGPPLRRCPGPSEWTLPSTFLPGKRHLGQNGCQAPGASGALEQPVPTPSLRWGAWLRVPVSPPLWWLEGGAGRVLGAALHGHDAGTRVSAPRYEVRGGPPNPQPSCPSGQAQAPGAHPALPSRPAALRHLREAGEHLLGVWTPRRRCPKQVPGDRVLPTVPGLTCTSWVPVLCWGCRAFAVS